MSVLAQISELGIATAMGMDAPMVGQAKAARCMASVCMRDLQPRQSPMHSQVTRADDAD